MSDVDKKEKLGESEGNDRKHTQDVVSTMIFDVIGDEEEALMKSESHVKQPKSGLLSIINDSEQEFYDCIES